jgi:hypothetical protein
MWVDTLTPALGQVTQPTTPQLQYMGQLMVLVLA